MSSQLPSNRVWDQAEALIVEIEQASQRSMNHGEQSFYDLATGRLASFSQASGVTLWCLDGGTIRSLATNPGLSASETPLPTPSSTSPANTPQETWSSTASAETGCQSQPGNASLAELQVVLHLHTDVVLALTARWNRNGEKFLEGTTERSIVADLFKATLELLSVHYLRHQFSHFRYQSSQIVRREQAISSLYQGKTLTESFQHIAATVAIEGRADRVLLATVSSRGSRLITSASDTPIDRRSRQAVLLESLLDAAKPFQDEIVFTVGSIDSIHRSNNPTPWGEQLDRYLGESGSRKIQIEFVRTVPNHGEPIAAIITEWFILPEEPIDQSFRKSVHEAVRVALARNTSVWNSLKHPLSSVSSKRKAVFTALALFALIFVLIAVPAQLTIPVEGRVVPENHRRLFASADSVVTDIFIRTGEAVAKGQRLVQLRSVAIDLREEQLRGELSSARTRLASLGASRNGSRQSDPGRSDELSISSDEETLKTELLGLEKQLALVEEQKRQLMIVSPIDGIADRWDLMQTLTMRPVVQGQYLLDVYAPTQTWVAELEMPDQHVKYLPYGANGVVQGDVRFRLQSHPDREYRAVIRDVAQSAHVDHQGRSLVRLKCQFTPIDTGSIAIGATVWADVECGYRPLGFVWFRGLFEWLERQSWY